MGICQLGYLGFGVKDIGAWRRLAVGVLGMQDGGLAPDGALYLRMDAAHHRIALHPTGEDDILYAGWQVESAADIGVLAARLGERGIAVTEASDDELAHRRVLRMVRFRDPAGYLVELYYGPVVPNQEPFQPGRRMDGFRTGALGLGHIVENAGDLDAAERFYIDVLGFRVGDYGFSGSVFMHCNPREHSLAFFGGPRLFRHVMVEVNTLDDVGKALDLCAENGVPIARTLGKHANDQMVSFYLVTPSGFEIEYGWGGRLIGDDWQVQVNQGGDVWGHKPGPGARPAARRAAPAKPRFPWLHRQDAD